MLLKLFKCMKNYIFCIVLLNGIAFSLNSQVIKRISTKDLIQISDSLGLDRVLDIVSPQSICYIDPVVARYFASKVDMNHWTDKEEWFLREFCTSQKPEIQQQTQNRYIENKIKLAEDYVPDKLGVFPFIEESEMYFLTVNPDQYREKLLIDYYNAWSKRSEPFKTEYDREQSTAKFYSLNYSSPDKHKVQSYWLCKENCYKILLVLREVGSKFATDQKMEEYCKILKRNSEKTKKYKSTYN